MLALDGVQHDADGSVNGSRKTGAWGFEAAERRSPAATLDLAPKRAQDEDAARRRARPAGGPRMGVSRAEVHRRNAFSASPGRTADGPGPALPPGDCLPATPASLA